MDSDSAVTPVEQDFSPVRTTTLVEQDFSPVQIARTRRRRTGLKTCATSVSVSTGVGVLVFAVSLMAPRAESPPNASIRFSDLADITPANVGRLQVAWTFHTGEFPGGQPNPTRPVTSMQSRPLLVGDLLIVTSDHGCDPTTASTDHSREHALLLAYAAGRNAAGRVHEEGEFADVGATVNAWLGGKSPGKRLPGRPIEL